MNPKCGKKSADYRLTGCSDWQFVTELKVNAFNTQNPHQSTQKRKQRLPFPCHGPSCCL